MTTCRPVVCLPRQIPPHPAPPPHLHPPATPQLAGQNETVMSLLTVPADYLDASKVSPLGIMLGHSSDAEESWRGPLLERLACHFAAAGHVVARYFCPLKEQVRARLRPAPATPCCAWHKWAGASLLLPAPAGCWP